MANDEFRFAEYVLDPNWKSLVCYFCVGETGCAAGEITLWDKEIEASQLLSHAFNFELRSGLHKTSSLAE